MRATLVDSYAKWVESVDFDGFRIDTIKHVEKGFWDVFTPAIRKRLGAQGKNDFFMFGEAFDGDDVLLGSYTVPGQLDSVFYFSQHYQVYRDVFQDSMGAMVLENGRLRLIVFDPDRREVVRWIP